MRVVVVGVVVLVAVVVWVRAVRAVGTPTGLKKNQKKINKNK